MSLEGTGVSLNVDDPAVPEGPSNLVLKAVDRLSRGQAAGRPLNLRIRLSKRIPPAPAWAAEAATRRRRSSGWTASSDSTREPHAS